MKYQKIY